MAKTPLVIRILYTVVTIFGIGTLSAQDFPNKPIRIVTSPAGSGSDVMARMLAQGIAGSLGQPVVVDNRPSNITPEIVANAPPDGYTLLLGGGNFLIGPLLTKASYDPVKNFSPITAIEMQVNVLVVHPSVPAKSVKELIALAKAKPGALNYGSGGAGSTPHITAELFKAMTDTNIVHIPYKGGGAVINALIANEVQLTFLNPGVVTPHVKSGKLRALAVTSTAPSALFPDLPTVGATVPKYESVGITGIFAPAKTPEAIIRRLNQEMVRFIKTAEAKEKFLILGSEPIGNSPEELAVYVKSEMAKWAKVIKDAGITAD